MLTMSFHIQVYSICDDYRVLHSKHMRLGLVHRLTSGCDAYIVEGELCNYEYTHMLYNLCGMLLIVVLVDSEEGSHMRPDQYPSIYRKCVRVLTQCDPSSQGFKDDIKRLTSVSNDELEYSYFRDINTHSKYHDKCYDGYDDGIDVIQMTYDV